jgi:hypothetical protein
MSKLESIIAQSGLPRETKAIFRQVKINKVVVEKSTGHLTIDVQSPRLFRLRTKGLFVMSSVPIFPMYRKYP